MTTFGWLEKIPSLREWVGQQVVEQAHIVLHGPECPPEPTDVVDIECRGCGARGRVAMTDVPVWAAPHALHAVG